MGITTSMSLELPTCVLLNSLVQSVNRTQFLNYWQLHLWLSCFLTDAIPLASMFGSLQSHKFEFNIEVLNMIWLLVLYVPRESSFISI